MATRTEPIRRDWQDDLQDLQAAEDFLLYFSIDFDTHVVEVNRLHILQRFHNYLAQAEPSMPDSDEGRWHVYKSLLGRAYQDFVDSDAQTEKVFQVFHMKGGCQSFVSIEQLTKSQQ